MRLCEVLGFGWAMSDKTLENGCKDRLSEHPSRRPGSVSAGEFDLAQREARAWKQRADEHARARAKIVLRMQAARRDVYDANLRAEEAEARAETAEVRAGEAQSRADRARDAARVAEQRSQAAERRRQAAEERHQAAEARAFETIALAVALAKCAEQERDSVLSSTVWRATSPLRTVGRSLPPSVRQGLRSVARAGWSRIALRLLVRSGGPSGDRTAQPHRDC